MTGEQGKHTRHQRGLSQACEAQEWYKLLGISVVREWTLTAMIGTREDYPPEELAQRP